MAASESGPSAKRYAVRLRGDRVLERAFREVYEEILLRNGKQAAGDYMRQCLLSGHALHNKQWPGPNQESAGAEIAGGQEVRQDSLTKNSNTQQNDIALVSDNESGNVVSEQEPSPASDQPAAENLEGAGQRQGEGITQGGRNIGVNVLRTIAQRQGESGKQNDAS